MMISTGPVDVPAALGRFHRSHPGVVVRLRLLPGGTADLARAVADGTLDLALLSLPSEPPAGITVRPLAQEPLVLICAPGHPLAAAGEVPLDALGGEAFIWLPSFGLLLAGGIVVGAGAGAGTAFRGLAAVLTVVLLGVARRVIA
jgi:DNA-binding transcriptional LysR family regulator